MQGRMAGPPNFCYFLIRTPVVSVGEFGLNVSLRFISDERLLAAKFDHVTQTPPFYRNLFRPVSFCHIVASCTPTFTHKAKLLFDSYIAPLGEFECLTSYLLQANRAVFDSNMVGVDSLLPLLAFSCEQNYVTSPCTSSTYPYTLFSWLTKDSLTPSVVPLLIWLLIDCRFSCGLGFLFISFAGLDRRSSFFWCQRSRCATSSSDLVPPQGRCFPLDKPQPF